MRKKAWIIVSIFILNRLLTQSSIAYAENWDGEMETVVLSVIVVEEDEEPSIGGAIAENELNPEAEKASEIEIEMSVESESEEGIDPDSDADLDLGPGIEVNDESGEDVIADTELEIDLGGEPETLNENEEVNEEETSLQEDIISLQVPDSIDFYLDPYEISGRQIGSEIYSFRNTGEQAVCIVFTSVTCSLAEDVVQASAEDSAESIRNRQDKAILLQLCFEDGMILNVGQNASGYQMILEPGESRFLSVGGCLSDAHLAEWETGDARITIVFSVLCVDEEVV